jgi:hypothetical protein
MKTAYAVLENTWEYNDEYYSQPEGGGGKPTIVFLTRKEADDECLEQNRDAFRSGKAQQYIYLGSMAEKSVNEVWEVFCEVMGEAFDLKELDKKAGSLDAVSKQLWEENKTKPDAFRRELAKKLFPNDTYKNVTGHRAQHEAWESADMKKLTDEQVDRIIAVFPQWQQFYTVVETQLAT